MSPCRETSPRAARGGPAHIQRSIATISLSGPLEEKLTAAAQAGFDGVEIFEGDLIACRLSPAEVRLRAADLGLRIMLYQPFRDFEAVPEDLLRRNLRRAGHKFELMASLGASMMLVCSNVSQAAIDDDACAADQLHRLAELARGHGMRLAYEALAWGRHIRSYLRAWQLVAAADHTQLGICLDSFHILSRGVLLHECCESLRPAIEVCGTLTRIGYSSPGGGNPYVGVRSVRSVRPFAPLSRRYALSLLRSPP